MAVSLNPAPTLWTQFRGPLASPAPRTTPAPTTVKPDPSATNLPLENRFAAPVATTHIQAMTDPDPQTRFPATSELVGVVSANRSVGAFFDPWDPASMDGLVSHVEGMIHLMQRMELERNDVSANATLSGSRALFVEALEHGLTVVAMEMAKDPGTNTGKGLPAGLRPAFERERLQASPPKIDHSTLFFSAVEQYLQGVLEVSKEGRVGFVIPHEGGGVSVVAKDGEFYQERLPHLLYRHRDNEEVPHIYHTGDHHGPEDFRFYLLTEPSPESEKPQDELEIRTMFMDGIPTGSMFHIHDETVAMPRPFWGRVLDTAHIAAVTIGEPIIDFIEDPLGTFQKTVWSTVDGTIELVSTLYGNASRGETPFNLDIRKTPMYAENFLLWTPQEKSEVYGRVLAELGSMYFSSWMTLPRRGQFANLPTFQYQVVPSGPGSLSLALRTPPGLDKFLPADRLFAKSTTPPGFRKLSDDVVPSRGDKVPKTSDGFAQFWEPNSGWTKPKGWRLPKNGTWSGTPGDSTFYPKDPASLGLPAGAKIEFRRGFPDFSEWAVEWYNVPGLFGTQADFGLIDEAIAKSKGWKNSRGKPDRQRAMKWRNSKGLVPHHCPFTNQIMMIHGCLHGYSGRFNGVRHAGSASFMRLFEKHGLDVKDASLGHQAAMKALHDFLTTNYFY